ncbi:MAG: divalent-cation tolerance protein CutA [Pseudomonadota bacterium]
MKDTPTEPILVSTTFPNLEEARLFAHQALERRLAACCNIIPSVISIYRWKDELCEDQECLVEIKTVKSRYSILEKLLYEVHPYELPMLLVLPVKGSEKYIAWIKKETL